MKQLISGLSLVLLFLTTVTMSQPGLGWGHCGGMGYGPARQIPQFTDEQKEEIRMLHESFRPGMQEIIQDKSLNPDEKRELILAKREAHRTRIMAVLTEEQQNAFEKFIQQRPLEKGGGSCGGFRNQGWMYNDRMELLVEYRKSFDEELSQDEKTTIGEFRTQIMADNPHFSNIVDCLHSGLRDYCQVHRDQLGPLFEIAKTHETNLDAIRNKIRIEAQNVCPNKGVRQGRRHGYGKRHGFGPCGGGQGHWIRFLLLDPENDLTGKGLSIENQIMVAIYPNPVLNEFTVDFDLPEKGNVKIELFSKGGNVREILLDESLDEGRQSFTFPADDLSAEEVYFVKIYTSNVIIVKKFIKL